MPAAAAAKAPAAAGKGPKQRQQMLPGGITRFSRSAMYKKKGSFKKLGKPVAGKSSAIATTKSVPVGGDKNGKTRTVATVKAPRYYSTHDIVRVTKKTKTQRAPKFRASLKPGTVVIILSGKFQGKRAVILKNLPSGLILVSGPFNVNGVPLKRVDPVYVIATSTSIDMKGVEVPAELDDAFFKRPESASKSGEFFEKKEDEAKTIDPKRIELQKKVDASLGKVISATPHLREYLHSMFSLRSGQYPHAMSW